jgi:hypothetical protein
MPLNGAPRPPPPAPPQVYWQVDELQKSLQFVSVSLDGHVALWTLAKAELQRELLMRLAPPPALGTEGAAAEAAPGAASSGTCIDFCQVGRQHGSRGV